MKTDRFFQVLRAAGHKHAHFIRRGTWFPEPSPGLCNECGMTQQRRIPPLVIEWEPGSDPVGDFSWGGFNSEIVVRRAVADVLSEVLSGFRLECIKTKEADDLDPDEAEARLPQQDRLPNPSAGVEICEIWITETLSLDHGVSEIALERECKTCGFKFYEPKKHGFVLRGALHQDFFRLEEYPSWVFCSEKAKRLIERNRYSNVAFLDVGRI